MKKEYEGSQTEYIFLLKILLHMQINTFYTSYIYLDLLRIFCRSKITKNHYKLKGNSTTYIHEYSLLIMRPSSSVAP